MYGQQQVRHTVRFCKMADEARKACKMSKNKHLLLSWNVGVIVCQTADTTSHYYWETVNNEQTPWDVLFLKKSSRLHHI